MPPRPREPNDDRPLRVVFLGSPAWALPTLQALHDSRDEIVAVYSQPDRRAGRGRKWTPPPVAAWAAEHGLAVHQPPVLRTRDELRRFEALDADVAVVVAFGKILGPRFLAAPRHGCINVHFSLLPRYRGAAPVQWAIIRGERVTGITTMQMDEGLDTGPILLQQSEPIRPDDSCVELGERLSVIGAELLLATLQMLRQGTLRATPQDESLASVAPSLTKQHGALDWNLSAEELQRLIRGTCPWPGAFTFRDGRRLKILDSVVDEPDVVPVARPGEVVRTDENGVYVACGRGVLLLRELQPEGKRAMDGPSFVNGFRVATGEKWVTKR